MGGTSSSAGRKGSVTNNTLNRTYSSLPANIISQLESQTVTAVAQFIANEGEGGESGDKEIEEIIKIILGPSPLQTLNQLARGQHTLVSKIIIKNSASTNNLLNWLSDSESKQKRVTVKHANNNTNNGNNASMKSCDAEDPMLNGLAQLVANTILTRLEIIPKLITSTELESSKILDNPIYWSMLRAAQSSCLAIEDKFQGIPFRRLMYADWKYGRSMNTLLKHVRHYASPSLLVFTEANTSNKIVVFIQSPWVETGWKMKGSPVSDGSILWGQSSIIQLSTTTTTGGSCDCIEYKIMNQKQSECFYLNTKIKGRDNGLGLGGKLGHHRIFIDKDFTDCTVKATSLCYDAGLLLQLASDEYEYKFEIGNVEVWGLGDGHSYDQLDLAGQRDLEIRRQARTVDVKEFYDNKFNREVMIDNGNAIENSR